MTHTVTVMDPAEVMERYEPASWDTWPEVIDWFLADPVDRERVDILRRELRRGAFRYPVVVTEGWAEDGDSCGPAICDGQHRLVAAFLEGRPVQVSWQLRDEPLDEWTVVVDVDWRMDDDRFDPFVSLPLADGTWAESGGCAVPYPDGCYELTYRLQPGTPLDCCGTPCRLSSHGTGGTRSCSGWSRRCTTRIGRTDGGTRGSAPRMRRRGGRCQLPHPPARPEWLLS